MQQKVLTLSTHLVHGNAQQCQLSRFFQEAWLGEKKSTSEEYDKYKSNMIGLVVKKKKHNNVNAHFQDFFNMLIRTCFCTWFILLLPLSVFAVVLLLWTESWRVCLHSYYSSTFINWTRLKAIPYLLLPTLDLSLI